MTAAETYRRAKWKEMGLFTAGASVLGWILWRERNLPFDKWQDFAFIAMISIPLVVCAGGATLRFLSIALRWDELQYERAVQKTLFWLVCFPVLLLGLGIAGALLGVHGSVPSWGVVVIILLLVLVFRTPAR